MKAIETIRKAREQAFEAKAEIEQRINETRQRIDSLCRVGVRPFDEAWSEWRERFEHYADQGRQRFELSLGEYAAPRDQNPLTGQISLRTHAGHPFEASERFDNGAVFAHINRAAILEQARTWFESKCQGDTVPPEAERKAEAQRLADQLKELETERDDVQDAIAELFGDTKPSERTRKAQRDELEQMHLQAING